MKAIKRKDLFHYNFLSQPTISPDGKTVAFIRSHCVEEENNYFSELYLYQNDSLQSLTSISNECHFIWDNNNTILYPITSNNTMNTIDSNTQASSTYYRVKTSGKDVGVPNKAFELPLLVDDIKKISDHTYIIVGKVNLAKTNSAMNTVQVLDELPFWRNKAGYVNKTRTGIFLYDEIKNQLTPLMSSEFNLSCYTVSNSYIYFAGETYSNKPINRQNIYSYNIHTKQITCTDLSSSLNISYMEALQDSILLMATDEKTYGIHQNPDFYQFNIGQKNIKPFVRYGESIGSSVVSDVRYGSSVPVHSYKDKTYFISTLRNRACLRSVDQKGNITTCIDQDGSVDGFDVSENQIFFTGLFGSQLQELYVCDKESGAIEQISHFNDDAFKDKYVAKCEKFTFQGATTDIDGWVLKPIGYDESKSYPAIFAIHGGPKVTYGEVFNHEMQYYAGLGYFVFYCNPEGSDGRGNAFADIRGKYGTLDYESLMSCVTNVLTMYPSIDSNRIAVIGGSYGGFMTNWIIGHTKRFACAITQRSISNWISFYGTSDIGPVFTKDQLASDIYEGSDKLWWHSPLKYASKVATPTLFIHAENDYRCPISEGIQFYSALINRKIPVRMCCFKGENHELSRSGRPLSRELRLKEISDWIEHYTK